MLRSACSQACTALLRLQRHVKHHTHCAHPAGNAAYTRKRHGHFNLCRLAVIQTCICATGHCKHLGTTKAAEHDGQSPVSTSLTMSADTRDHIYQQFSDTTCKRTPLSTPHHSHTTSCIHSFSTANRTDADIASNTGHCLAISQPCDSTRNMPASQV